MNEQTEQYLILLFDISLYVLTFIFLLLRIRRINVGMLVLLIMTISHLGILPYYFIQQEFGIYIRLTLFPFIFLYLMIIMGLCPFIKKNRIFKVDVSGNKDVMYYFAIGLIILSIVPLLENIVILFKGTYSFSDVYEEKRAENLKIYTGLTSMFMNLLRQFYILSTVLLFYYLSRYRKFKYLVIGLCLCQLNYLLNSINTASRGGIISQIGMCICCLMLFENLYDKRLLKKIRKMVLIISVPFFLITYIIGLSRYESSNMIRSYDSWMLLYLSDGPLKFNAEMWSGKHNTNGDVNLCYFKNLLGLQTYTTYESRDSHYTRLNGRRIEQFYTYVGDFISDFGVLGAFVVCLSLFMVSFRLLRRRTVPIYNFFPLLLIIHMYFIGFTSNIYRSFGLQKSVFILFFIYIIMYFNRSLHNNNVLYKMK